MTVETIVVSIRKVIILIRTLDEHFYTLYIIILDEVNYTHQSFYSYFDDVLEHASIAANTRIYEEPGLNDLEPKSFTKVIQQPDSTKWKEVIDIEMKQYQENGTFELIELPTERIVLNGK